MADSEYSIQSSTLRTVFLDRDGVLNRKLPEDQYVRSWSEFEPLSGVRESIARLNQAHLHVIVVSNQRGIARGFYTAEDVHCIHRALQDWLQSEGAHIDAFFFCPHDKQQCNCRKPLPGLFDQARARFPDIAPESSMMIGDSLSDIQFGHCLGMRTIFLDGDPQLQKPDAISARHLADLCFTSLPEATSALLAHLPSPTQS